MKYVLFVWFLLFSVSSFSETVHPIEKELNLCLSKNENQTTAGMNNCVSTATAAWDKELNVVYKKLMSSLGAEAKEDLKSSQIAWLKHRDLEFKLINSIYEKKIGTMYTNIKAMNVLVVTKNRTLELSSYLE